MPKLNHVIASYVGGGETFASKSMKASYHLIKREDLSWRPSNLMRIPNADYLERTGSENLGGGSVADFCISFTITRRWRIAGRFGTI